MFPKLLKTVLSSPELVLSDSTMEYAEIKNAPVFVYLLYSNTVICSLNIIKWFFVCWLGPLPVPKVFPAVFSRCWHSRLTWNFLGRLGRVCLLSGIENRKAVWLFLKFISKFISILYNTEEAHPAQTAQKISGQPAVSTPWEHWFPVLISQKSLVA